MRFGETRTQNKKSEDLLEFIPGNRLKEQNVESTLVLPVYVNEATVEDLSRVIKGIYKD